MSMIMYLKQASEIELARFAREGVDPSELVAESGGLDINIGHIDALKQRLDAQKPQTSDPELLQRWQTYRSTMEKQFEMATAALSARPKRKAAGGKPALDLHKSWHILHYLLCGSAWQGSQPAAALLAGGREVGEDLGYGPARTLSPQETKAFAQFLSRESVPALVKRIDQSAMQRLGVYCAEAPDLSEDVDHYFPQLQSYVGDAAANGCGLLIWLG